MRNQHLHKAVLALTIGIALTLGACTRSASTPPSATGEAAGTTPSGLNAQQATMEAVRSSLLTQTAQAMAGTEGSPTAEPTDVVAQDTPSTSQSTSVAPAATSAPVATATAGLPTTYTLHEGEHPYCIARRFDVSPVALLAVNGLTASSFTPEGTILTIPSDSTGFPPPRTLKSHPTTYTVQPGDTIYAIACIFGDVDPNAIAQANGLSAPYTLSAGTVLNIP
jgi:LysM repeat protein